MDHSAHNKIVSFIWSIADDCLRRWTAGQCLIVPPVLVPDEPTECL